MAEKIQFQANTPVTLALKFAQGKEAPSQFGDGVQYFYSTVDDRCFYATPALNQRIEALKPKVREEITITKKQQGRTTEWIVERPGVQDQTAPSCAAAPESTQQNQHTPAIAMDRAVRMFLILAGEAKLEAERVLGCPVDSITQALACTMFIESAKKGFISWVNPEVAQQHIAGQKIRDLQLPAAETPKFPPAKEAWRTRGEMRSAFAKLREAVGEVEYWAELKGAGITDPGQLTKPDAARALYDRLVARVQQNRRAA